MKRFGPLLLPIVCIAGCDQHTQSVSDRQQVLERCSSLLAQNRYQEGATCLEPLEQDAKPDRQTAAAAYQLGQLFESGRGVRADLDHAVRLYKVAERLDNVAPDIAKQASVAATKLINRMRQAEEP
jgi:TPR repeat protein